MEDEGERNEPTIVTKSFKKDWGKEKNDPVVKTLDLELGSISFLFEWSYSLVEFNLSMPQFPISKTGSD